jgi:hypothetical protein
MIIECFFDPIFVDWQVKQKISSFRYGRHQNTANKPNKNNVFEINDQDFVLLIQAIDHVAILCQEFEADFFSWNLCLKIIDDKKWNIEKDSFLENVLWTEKVVVGFENLNRDHKKRNIEDSPRDDSKKIIWNVTDNWSKKIYHHPNDKWYDSVEYDKERGDMLFDSEEEAIKAWFEMKAKKEKSVEETDQKE